MDEGDAIPSSPNWWAEADDDGPSNRRKDVDRTAEKNSWNGLADQADRCKDDGDQVVVRRSSWILKGCHEGSH